MDITAEIRWFGSGAVPKDLSDWFQNTSLPLSGEIPRTDRYLLDPNQLELGIKERGEKSGVEIKGLVSLRPSGIATGPFGGSVEIWSKWNSETLSLEGCTTVQIEKSRLLRRFVIQSDRATEIAIGDRADGTKPKDGCDIELCRLQTHRTDEAWTLALEAFGELSSVVENLRLTAAQLNARQIRLPETAQELSYPAWLARIFAG
jgi:hypothetical protein